MVEDDLNSPLQVAIHIPAAKGNTMASVLVVDDSPVDRRLVGALLAKTPNIDVLYAADGEEALSVLSQRRPNLVVTDLIMPNMDGLELVAAIVSKYPLVPVILMTGKGSEEIAVQALKAGAASYVPKSVVQNLLVETVENVLSMAQEEQTQAKLSECMTGCYFVIENDASLISAMVKYVRSFVRRTGLCDETNSIRTCVALEEALNNAMFHGNLEIDSTLREQDRTLYRTLIDERRRAEPYGSRRIHVDIRVTATHGEFVIRDEGRGFDPRQLPDPTDPLNIEKPSGRGLLLMRTFMDDVSFNDRGNEVTLVKRRTAH
jgi:CheY-like chemotaxis protein/anti-sigma regulatory factor (Ser/Thr protein kinase)